MFKLKVELVLVLIGRKKMCRTVKPHVTKGSKKRARLVQPPVTKGSKKRARTWFT